MAGERNGPGAAVWASWYDRSLVSEAQKPGTPELPSGSRPIQQRIVCVEVGQTFSIQRVKLLMP
jgi:hypothetical protein